MEKIWQQNKAELPNEEIVKMKNIFYLGSGLMHLYNNAD